METIQTIVDQMIFVLIKFVFLSLYVWSIGACHGDDLSYYFRTLSSGPDPAEDTAEWRTIERMCAIFSTFARFGDPNNECIGSIQWNPIKIDAADDKKFSYKCLNVSHEVSYIEWPDLVHLKFWDKIYEQLVKME